MTTPTVVSTTPSGTEICYALGIEPVAVSHRCDFPPAVQDLPTVTGHGPDGYVIDVEMLAELAPDAIVTQSVCGVCAVDEPLVRSALEELAAEPKVVSLDAAQLPDVTRCVQKVGEEVGRSDRAGRIIGQFQDCIDRIEKHTATASNWPRVVVLEWLDPLRIAGNWVPELVAAAGGRSHLIEPGDRSRAIDRNELLTVDPEILVIAPCGLDADQARTETEGLRDWSGWADLTAVRNERIFTFDGRILSRWTPRLAGELERLAAALHPSLFEGAPAGFSSCATGR